jgi:cytoskeletal protein CcmA (bactofilin family)
MSMLNTDRKTQSSQPGPTGPGGQPAATAAYMPSVIGPELRIVGNLHCTGSIQVEGTVEGQITGQTVNIVEGAQVSGPINADAVQVSGAINGQIEGNSVILTSTAKVKGSITHKTLSIEAGARVEGQFSRLEKTVNISSKAEPATPKPAEQQHAKNTKTVGSGDAAKLQSEVKERVEK